MVVQGIAFAMLTSQQEAARMSSGGSVGARAEAEKVKAHLFQQLSGIVRDNYAKFISVLCQILVESTELLKPAVLEDTVWILDKLIT